jgi:hypothetical protein
MLRCASLATVIVLATAASPSAQPASPAAPSSPPAVEAPNAPEAMEEVQLGDHWVKRTMIKRADKHLRASNCLELIEYGRKQ